MKLKPEIGKLVKDIIKNPTNIKNLPNLFTNYVLIPRAVEFDDANDFVRGLIVKSDDEDNIWVHTLVETNQKMNKIFSKSIEFADDFAGKLGVGVPEVVTDVAELGILIGNGVNLAQIIAAKAGTAVGDVVSTNPLESWTGKPSSHAGPPLGTVDPIKFLKEQVVNSRTKFQSQNKGGVK
jgi:hypothetical protein